MIFWKDCPDQIGSALIASLMCKSLAREAKFAGYHHLADKLNVNAGLVIIFCCTCSSMELGDLSAKFKALRTLFQPNFYSSFWNNVFRPSGHIINLVIFRFRFSFITALHAMQTRSSDENSVCLSVCSSVCLSAKRVLCDKTVERSVQIYIPYERKFSLVFWEEEWYLGATLLPEILGQPTPVGAKSPIFNQ